MLDDCFPSFEDPTVCIVWLLEKWLQTWRGCSCISRVDDVFSILTIHDDHHDDDAPVELMAGGKLQAFDHLIDGYDSCLSGSHTLWVLIYRQEVKDLSMVYGSSQEMPVHLLWSGSISCPAVSCMHHFSCMKLHEWEILDWRDLLSFFVRKRMRKCRETIDVSISLLIREFILLSLEFSVIVWPFNWLEEC